MSSNLREMKKNTQDQKMALICQLLYAVACLHQIGIVHGDLKPENIFINNQNGLLKIGDFGESAYINMQRSMPSEMSRITGMTPEFIPPESVNQLRTSSTKFDLWSLGLVILEILVAPKKLPVPVGKIKEMKQKEINDLIKLVINLKSSEETTLMRELLQKSIKN